MTAQATPPQASELPYTMRERRSDELPAILELMRASLGETEILKRTEDMWSWKHEISPFGRSHVLLAESEAHDGKIIGLRAFLRWEFERAGKTLRGVRAVDTSTHPDFRRMGLFKNLTLQAVADVREEGVDFVFNTPNDMSRPGYLKMGWQTIGTVQPVVRILNYPKFIWGMGRAKILKWPGNASTERCFEGGNPGTVESLVSRADVHSLIEQDTVIWGDMLHTKHSRDYYMWRYAQHPTIDYRAVGIESDEGLEAMAIFRANSRFGLREIVLSEMLLAREDLDLARRLLKSVADHVRADYIVGYYPQGTFHRAALDGNRFRKLPGEWLILTANPLSGSLGDLEDLGNWGVSMGDLELL